MKNKELIKKLQKLNPDGDVWINDEQGRNVLANPPHEANQDDYDGDLPLYDDFSGDETVKEGDIVISFENT